MAAYATSTDMVARYDERTLKELCSDGNAPVEDLSIDTKMAACLDDATGAINAALRVGGQYKVTDLEELTDESQAYLKRLTCELAMGFLIRRRPEKYAKTKDVQEGMDAILEQFRSGVRVFDIDANVASGSPSVDGPTRVEFRNLGLVRDQGHFYPRRNLPAG